MSSPVTLSLGRLGGIGVGGPDIGEIAPGQDEHHPPVDRAGEGDRLAVVDPGPVHDDVHALGGPEQRRGAGVLQPADLVGPGPGRVHHHAGSDDAPALRSAGPPAGPRPPGPAVRSSASHRHVVGHQGSVMDGRSGRGYRPAGHHRTGHRSSAPRRADPGPAASAPPPACRACPACGGAAHCGTVPATS